MKAARLWRKFFTESPTYGRDRANLISGLTIGTAALFLNGAVLMLVLPLLFMPDAPSLQRLTDNLGFGQLMALVLLGGSSAFATLLIPLRLATVFFEPRIGRYFDQIVLSGISPLRFVIGKATSQNLFLGLMLFLLLPYLVLSLTLGGVDLGFFAAGLFLVWLYCLSLALATLWISLYVNEFLAAAFVIGLASIICLLGSMPFQIQPFVLSPFPALFNPVYTTIPETKFRVAQEFRLVFASCALGMSAFIVSALFAIFLGPLYGIIRENSTFGEVVRAGDSRRKRWFRFRLHIQRSSELAFFYENRSDRILRYEGLVRWGIGFWGMVGLSAAAYFLVVETLRRILIARGASYGAGVYWLETSLHGAVLTVHAVGLALAVLLFSHAKNTTYLRLPLLRGFTAEVSKLDTAAFLFFLIFSTAASLATPVLFEQHVAVPLGTTVFSKTSSGIGYQNYERDFTRIWLEGTAIITTVGLVIYAFQRQLCLGMWMKSVSFVTVGGLYAVLVGLVPIMFGAIVLEIVDDFYRSPLLVAWAPTVAAVSPGMAMVIVFDGRPGGPFPDDLSTGSFYAFHSLLFVATLWWLRRTGRKVCSLYLTNSIVRGVLALMLSIGLGSAAFAQPDPPPDADTPGLTIEAVAGWGGYVDRAGPLPASFLLRNDSGRTLEGTLTLSERAGGREVSLGEVFLAPGTSRRVTSIQSIADWYDCYATLRRHREILWRRKLDLYGKSFNANVNYALFVEEHGRKLALPGAPEEAIAYGVRETQVAGPAGRPVECLSAKPWQLANHPGPLFCVQAIIFPEGAVERDVNPLQWDAVAQWMCQGGVVFVHRSSQEIAERLLKSSPLGADPPVSADGFQVRRCGLGALYEYDRPLLAADHQEITQAIAQVVSRLTKDEINALADSAYFTAQRGGEANRNRNWMLGLFGFYTLFSGCGALFLFRLTRKQLAIYTVAVVATASLLAGLLGGYLRLSRGDLRWLTVTQAGAGGLIQIGGLEVQSAGSRNTRVAIRSEHPDLQYVGKPEYYYWQQWNNGYPAFTWQANRETEDPGLYRIEVPMSPWGRRRCHATAYRRNAESLDVDLQFIPNTALPGNPQNSPATPTGKLSLKIHNRLPFDLHDCWLVVGATQAAPANWETLNIRRNYGNNSTVAVEGLIDVYHRQQLQDLVSGTSYDVQSQSNFTIVQNPWEMAQFWPAELRPYHSRHSLRIPRMGAAQAWLIGRLSRSPAMDIDEPHGDFVPHDGVHVFIQEIRSEDLPDTLKALSGGSATK